MAGGVSEAGEDRGVSAPPTTPGRSRLAGWAVVGLILLLEYALFRHCVQREVEWCYPRNHDQVTYLTNSYSIYERILDRGLWRGLAYGLTLRTDTGIMLPLQGGLLHLLLGPGRLSALTLNFLYFALLQCMLVGTVRWYSGRWSLALFALGLLLAAGTPFLDAGGLTDFRIDLIASCLFGIFTCLALRSRLFASWGWSLAVAAAAVCLVLFRFLSAMYLAGILGTFFLFLCVSLYRSRRDVAARWHRLCQLRGVVTVGVLLILLAAPVVWHNRAGIRGHYIDHLNNGESAVVNRLYGVQATADRLLYYPKSMLGDHTGPTFLVLGGVALATALVAGRFSRPANPSLEPPLRAATGFASVCLLIPMLVLTVYASPSPVVGGLIVPAVVWLVVLTTLGLARMQSAGAAGRLQTAWAATLAVMALLTGFGAYAAPLSRHGQMSSLRSDVDQVLQLYDELARRSQESGCASPVVASNDLRDYLHPAIAGPVIYERHHHFLPVHAALVCGMRAVTEADAMAAVQRSDFVIMNAGPAPGGSCPPAPGFVYPFLESMNEMRPRLPAACEQEFMPLGHYRLFGDEVILYGRPPLRVSGTTADGWVTRDGLTLTTCGAALRRFPRIELRGQADFSLLGKVPAVRADIQVPGQASRTLPAAIVTSDRQYTITVDLDPAEFADQSSLTVHLTLDTYFSPREKIPDNNDPRYLVVRAPERARMVRRP
jgi:hypothetical protein